MTVQKLIEELKGLAPDTPVILSRDAEGNGYSPLATLGVARYVAHNTWSGELAEDDGGTPAVVMWPTN